MKHPIIGQVLLSQVIERLHPVKPKGANYISKCVSGLHSDTRPSLVVNDARMSFKCFSCGWSGDAIDYIMKTQDVKFERAIAILEGDDRLIVPENETKELLKKREKKSFEVLPIANEVEYKPSYFHNEYGMPKVRYAYRNIFNKLIAYTCRFEHVDGSKDVLPYTFGVFENGNYAWQYAGFPNPRPIYGMQYIGAYPDATIIVVEGEKCADYGNSKIHHSDHRGKYVFVSWIGGSNAVPKTDFGILADKNVIHWSDNDKAGFDATKRISGLIGGRFIHIPEDKPEKWDVADFDCTADELVDFIVNNTQPKQQRWKADVEAEKASLPPMLPEIKDKPKYYDRLGEYYFRVLGYSKNEKNQLTFWFYSFESKLVISFNAPSLTKTNLMTLAPIQWWERRFPGHGNSKFDTDQAVQSIINACNDAGIFNEEDKIRGRGAWRDGNDVVLHVGNGLIVNNNMPISLNEYATDHIYEINKTIKYGGADPLTNEDSAKFMELMRWFAWDRNTTPLTFAGWLVIAPFCGVLDSRPNGWLTSTSHGGKSWIQDNVIKMVLGNVAINVNSETTAAGIRQFLQSDARPVLFDESEVKDDKSRARIGEILFMLRGAFQKGGAPIIKGSTEGRAKAYEMKTMAMFSSISVYLPDKADQRRCLIFNLKYDANKRGEAFEQFKERYFSVVTPEYIKALQARTIKMLPVIIHNTNVFKLAINKIAKDIEIGDLLGGLIAAAYSLLSDDLITIDEAIEYLRNYDWSHEIEQKGVKDEVIMLDELMSMQIKVDHVHTYTIGEMIVFEYDPRILSESVGGAIESAILRKEIKRILGNHGIKYVDGKGVCFANGNPALRRLMNRSQWVHNIEGLMMRLPGAEKDDPRVYQTGLKSHRGIRIPIELIVESVG